MGRLLKGLGIVLGLIVACLILAAVGIYFTSESNLNKTYAVDVEALEIPTDEAVIERGEYLVTAIGGCWHCHGDNLGGDVLIDDPALGMIYAPNLTRGEGGVAEFTDEDWIRAVRHGVDPEGRALIIMPSKDYFHFSDADLVAIIAYVKSLPPVDNAGETTSLGPVGRVLIATAPDNLLPARSIDHDQETVAVMEPEVSADYGEYLVTISCMGCHGEDLGGTEALEPGGIAPPNLTPGGIFEGYTLENFNHFLHTGESFAGREVDDENMPWTAYQHLTDEDIEAIYLYIKSVPAVEN